MERHILVILPHPDDEAFSSSGTLASHIHKGTPVTYACLTLGEMGRNMGSPLFANRVTLPTIRRVELEESCRAIGIEDLRMLGFHDKTIEFDQTRLTQKVEELLEELKPSLVITFYPGYSVHPDHDATGAAVIRAIGKLPAADRPVIHCIAFSKGCENEIGKPDIINDVKEYTEHKIRSVQAHKSQFSLGQMVTGKSVDDPAVRQRLGTEQFWTYRM
ncbi:bacillithiol biosynthesis deacetylase BshB2 [Paenibacillus lutrae]|uniref:Bacillithiol biosynthesis deacetylase BshB2 n=1 Tax=Paenibacillus lutrae TaxID=2078573 RepID=A0A7X3FKB5_9BACL|nr:bacillithiol biosynthesis deacetylase BshB2 [Paenibacillus lutrae]MVP01188.1 bacillithiol biosynthesis deacetylase BshB2 [Paenibacillus lutrae]